MPVIGIRTPSHWKKILEDSYNKRIIVDIWSKHCSPCAKFMPIYEKFSNDYPDCEFYKMSIEEMKETVKTLKITKIPTVIFIKNGEEIIDKRLSGSMTADLEYHITTHI